MFDPKLPMRGLVVALAVAAALAACAAAPPGPPAGTPPFVRTVDGQVLGVDGVPPERRLAENLRLTLRSGSEPVVVELAPGWYLEQRGLRFERNQSIAVDGTVDRERNLIVARRVRANSVSVELRDDAGKALWPRADPDAGVRPVPPAAP
jgi:hypothetical protein